MQSIAITLTWVVNIFYIAAMIPEIIAYYREKKGRELSVWMLLLLVNGYAWNAFYVLCSDFPFSYTLTVSITFLLSLILIFQHFYYDRSRLSSSLIRMYWFSLGVALGMAFFACTHSYFIGWFAGWLNVAAWSVLQVPQIVHVVRKRSIKGCNMNFLCLFAAGELLEFACAITLKLPLQTLVSNICALLGYAILCGMFFRYRAPTINRYHERLCQKSICPWEKCSS